MDRVRHRIRQLRNLLRRQGRSRDDADDLIQEAFLRLHVYCQNKEVKQRQAFLTRTALNLSVDLYRKERRELFSGEPIENLPLVDIQPTPDEDFFARQRLTLAARVLEALSPRTREIFIMHRVEGYGCAQIAAHFHISVSAVEKHIAKAVLSLMDVAERQ